MRCLDDALGLSPSGNGTCAPYTGPSTATTAKKGSLQATAQVDAAQYTPTISGTLSSGESRTFPIRLEGAQAQALLGWARGTLDFTLRTPDGTVVTPANAAQVLTDGVYASSPAADSLPLATYAMRNPAAGEWQATITASNVVTNTTFALFGALASSATLTLDPPQSVAANQPVALTARLADAGTPVSGGAVAGTLETTAGPRNITFAETSPGTYSATVPAPAAPGSHLLQVVANGPAARPFARQADLLLTVLASDVAPAGAASAQGIPGPGGRFTALRVTAPVMVNRAATYAAAAILRAADGTEITRQTVDVTWPTGAQTLVIDLDGAAIGAAGIDGPYTVDLQIVAADTVQTTLDARPLATTPPYRASQFIGGPQERVYIPLVRR